MQNSRTAVGVDPEFPAADPNDLAACPRSHNFPRIAVGRSASLPLCGIRFAQLSAFVVLAVAAAFAVPADSRLTGTPLVSTWDSKDYGISPGTNWIVQHPQTGFVYVGNSFGVFEFDGASWRFLSMPVQTVVPVVLVDAQGTVWLGCTNAVAVLQPDAKGELQPVDVTARLSEAEREFGRLYLGTVGPAGVYFASPTHLLFFGYDGTTRTWETGPEIFNGVCWFDGALHVSREKGGLARLEDGAFVTIAPPPRSPEPEIADSLRFFAARRDVGAAEALLLTDVGRMHWTGPGRAMVPLSASTTACVKAM